MAGEFDHTAVPIIVNCRDKVTPTRLLVEWLERAGHERIHLLDNASTYPPLLEYLAASPHQVVRLRRNLGHRAPWKSGLVKNVSGGRPYVVTDPDVVPSEECPADAVAMFHEALQRFPGYVKAGFGLRLDDLPSCFRHRDDVRNWERRFWRDEIAPGLYEASIDTTFALYPGRRRFQLEPALRTGPPYVARHLPWYADSDNPSDEDTFYRAHAQAHTVTWDGDQLPHELAQKLETLAADPDGSQLSAGRIGARDILGSVRRRLGR